MDEYTAYKCMTWKFDKHLQDMTDEELKNYAYVLHAISSQALEYTKACKRNPATITITALDLKELANMFDKKLTERF